MTTVYTQDSQVWVTSDLHLGHDKPFIWEARGFDSVQEMNQTIIKNLQKTITKPTDELYICGDVTLGEINREILWQIPGRVHIILGNHDTDARAQVYKDLGWSVSFGERIKYTDGTKKGQMSFLLTHYPTLTANSKDKISQWVINISGHTHSSQKWIPDYPFIYNVACDANDCSPVALSTIVNFMKEKINSFQ